MRLRESAGFFYLASPYSMFADGLDAAFEEAARASAFLMRNGIIVFSAICHSHPIAKHGNINPTDAKFWLKADEPMMDAACGLIVVRMPGWEKSDGIAYEIDVFKAAGKPIFWIEWPNAK